MYIYVRARVCDLNRYLMELLSRFVIWVTCIAISVATVALFRGLHTKLVIERPLLSHRWFGWCEFARSGCSSKATQASPTKCRARCDSMKQAAPWCGCYLWHNLSCGGAAGKQQLRRLHSCVCVLRCCCESSHSHKFMNATALPHLHVIHTRVLIHDFGKLRCPGVGKIQRAMRLDRVEKTASAAALHVQQPTKLTWKFVQSIKLMCQQFRLCPSLRVHVQYVARQHWS